MRPKTIWQRLNTALVLLIVLLLAGVGLAFWVSNTRATATRRSDRLSLFQAHIAADLVTLSDALRGILLDPTNAVESVRLNKAQVDLRLNQILPLQSEFSEYHELTQAANKLGAFLLAPDHDYQRFQTNLLALAASNPENALTYCNTKANQALLRQRDELFGVLARKMEAAKAAESTRADTIGIVGCSGLCVLLLAGLLVGRLQSAAVAEPLSALVAVIERMRQGDFTQRLPADRKDEFGVLNTGLNRLAEDLSELVGQVQRSGQQVNHTSAEIAASSGHQQTAAREIAATTAEIGATSRQISTTSKDLVQTMNEVNQVAEQTGQLAGGGQTALTRMETSMRQLMEASGAITTRLNALSDKATNINSVVTTITKVADQTNLLSLNAAIEAEKAGEYGLGFAVVAMEIRRLADQTAVATYDIEKMVKEMQSAVVAGVMGMDKFSEEVRRGVEEVRQVSSLLAQIIQQVQTLAPRFQTVNDGMHAQANGAQQISETLLQLSDAARQTAESLRQSNLAIEQLNSAAQGLQASVARFRLNPPS